MWIAILIIVLSALIAGFVWMAFAVCRFTTLKSLLPQKKWKRTLCGAGIVAVVMLCLYLAMDFINMVMVFLHLLLIWLICEGIGSIVKRITKQTFRCYYSGISAILLTFIWLMIGWYNAHHISRTEYNLTTSKHLGVSGLKIIGLSDSHVGATFHWQEFEEYIDRINAEHPDVVVIMGDFVDDDTSKEDMLHCCEALGRLKTRYGVYFVYGNHDEGYWRDNGRGYTLADLDKQLEKNKVKILRDETLPVVGNIYMCGRLDKSRSRDRKSASTLMSSSKSTDYVVCLDHEPNDYEAEAKSRMDLVISGHTHGGQFLGLGTIGVLMGANDAYYGQEKRQSTNFIVSSGIGDWAIKFKTGCISEYIVVNLQAK